MEFRLDWLLDLAHQVGGGPDVVGRVDDLRPCFDEFVVVHGRARAGVLFDVDRVPGRDQLPHAGRGHGDPVLVVFQFLGYADDHWLTAVYLFLNVAHDVLDPGVVLESVGGEILAVPRVLEPTVRHFGHQWDVGIDPHTPEIEVARHPHGPAVVPCPHRRGQAVFHSVGPGQS